ncbi:MAG: Hpt domain-containing protein, partial [Planctomycetota bacterium]
MNGSAHGNEKLVIEECSELLSGLQGDLLGLRSRRPGQTTRDRMQRSAHTAKGLIGFLGIEEMDRLASGIEEVLRRFRDDEKVAPMPQTVDRITFEVKRLMGLLTPLGRAQVLAGGEGREAPVAKSVPGQSDSQAAALSEAITEVLAGFDVPGAECTELAGTDDKQDDFDGPGGLAVVADLGTKVGASVVAHFGPAVTRPVAGKVAAFIFGEEVSVSEGEEDELVRGALGELVNYIAIATLTKLGLPPETGAPRFVTGGRLLARPGGMRRVSVQTELGAFWIALAAGEPCFEEGDSTASSGQASAARGTVVVTDDSMVMRKTLERLLVKAGFEIVAEARNGQEAV